jgi:hypothetical protein
VRFGVKTVFSEEQAKREGLKLRYVCERDHRPVESGFLEFDVASGEWRARHVDARVQRMAECYLATYFERKKNQAERLAS